MPVQLFFALDRVKALAPQHPEWKTKQPFASLLKGDLKGAFAGGDHAILELVMATHAGMTTAEFEQIVKDWLATAKHPKFKQPYTACVYQPMVELLAYLRGNGFKTFIVSGGGIEFMRPWAEQVYGVPPEQVIGSSIKTKFEMRDGKPVLVRLPEINFIDDKAGKPVGINQHIGRRPIAAFGNSDGDKEMLEYTQGGSGARFMLLVLHDDAAREYAYGPAQGLPDAKLGAFTPHFDIRPLRENSVEVSSDRDHGSGACSFANSNSISFRIDLDFRKTALAQHLRMRYARRPIDWASAQPISHGTCADLDAGAVYAGRISARLGLRFSCTVEGLSPSTTYDFQMVAYREDSTGVTYGPLSVIATATTTGTLQPRGPDSVLFNGHWVRMMTK